MYKRINTRGFAILGTALLITIFTLVSCSQVREAAYRGVTSAVSDKVEVEVYRGVSSMLAGYSSAMLYQLAYTQAFLVGGYGIGMEDFEEGQGSTWRIEAGENEDSVSYTTERALLKKESDGSNWWYLRYEPEQEGAIEYEIKMSRSMAPMEMYMRNPETGEVDHHHVFDDGSRDYDDEVSELEEDGFHTAYYNLDDWEEYREGTENIRIGGNSFQATILFYEGTEEKGDENVKMRWWVTEEVPGQLLRYEMRDKKDGGRAFGEMTDFRDRYTPKFASF